MAKSCNKCIHKVISQSCKGSTKVCKKYIFYKANCVVCENRKLCKKLDKSVTNKDWCANFQKKKGNLLIKKRKKKKYIDVDKEIKKLKYKYEERGKLEEFNPVDIIDKIIDTDYDPDAFELIDSSCIERPNNPIEFLMEKRFLAIKPFPRQLQICLEVFSSYCPYCSNTDFIRNKIEVNTDLDNILDKTMLYKHGICPKCKSSKYEAIEKGDHNLYNTMIGIVGQRAGKSALSAMIASILTSQYILLPNPGDFFQLLKSVSTIQGTFIGLRYDDAIQNLWDPFYNIITTSPWFSNVNKFLKDEGNKLGVELIRLRNTFVVYTWKQLGLFPAGPDKRALRGKTRIFHFLDELSWFTGVEQEIKNPEEVLKALDNSLLTIRVKTKKMLKDHPYLYPVLSASVSSPRSKNDKGMILYNQSKNIKSIYGFKGPTWWFSPDVCRKDLDDYYLKDPLGSERDFGSNPPFGENPYISSPATLVNVFSNKKNIFRINGYETVKDSLGGKLIYPKLGTRMVHSFPSILAVDTGAVNNSFSLTLSHWREDEEGNYIFATSGIIEIIPEGHPLSFPDIYSKVISPILSRFNVKIVAFDRWQSINLSQQVYQDFGIDAITYSVNKYDFADLKTSINAGDCLFPKLEFEIKELLSLEKNIEHYTKYPCSHLFLQFLLSKDTGRTVLKGDGITDDILRCIVLGYSLINNEEYSNMFDLVGSERNLKYKDINSFIRIHEKSKDLISSNNYITMTSQGNKLVKGIGIIKSKGIM